jgi:hypothetical protein
LTLKSGKGQKGVVDELAPYKKGAVDLSKKKFKISLITAMDDGLYYKYGQIGKEIFWPYPIFIDNYIQVPSLSPDPLRVEFMKRGKKYYFLFYHHKRGMIGRTEVGGDNRTNIVKELLSKKGDVKRGGEVSAHFVGTIFSVQLNKLQDMVDNMFVINLEAPLK